MADLQATPYNTADQLKTPEDASAYLAVCFQEHGNDAELIARGLSNIARSDGMARAAREAGVSIETIREPFTAGRKPRWSDVQSIMKVLGMRFRVEVSGS